MATQTIGQFSLVGAPDLLSALIDVTREYTEAIMNIGMNTRVSSRSLDVAIVAQKAEALGFESLWLPEHGVMPVHVTTRYQGSPDGSIPAVHE